MGSTITSLDALLTHRYNVLFGLEKEPEPEPVFFGPPTREQALEQRLAAIERHIEGVQRMADPRTTMCADHCVCGRCR